MNAQTCLRLAVLSLCVAAAADRLAGAEQPKVRDEATGITVAVQEDQRTLVATDKDGKALWRVDVIKTAGAPKVGQPVVRALMQKGPTVTAVYGKHTFAEFDLADGKLRSVASD